VRAPDQRAARQFAAQRFWIATTDEDRGAEGEIATNPWVLPQLVEVREIASVIPEEDSSPMLLEPDPPFDQ
jgi:hypothetical protein